MHTMPQLIKPVARPQILCVMVLPPNPEGHGGSQRAWRLVEALQPYGDIHFVLIHDAEASVAIQTPLEPLSPFVASITRIKIDEWHGRKRKLLKVFHPKIADFAKFGSFSAPHFSNRILKNIACQLKVRDVDLVFAGRITSAAIVQSLINQKLITAKRKVVDFDDVLSKFRKRENEKTGSVQGFQGRLLGKLDTYLISREESNIAQGWNGVSVCSDEDVSALACQFKGLHVVKVPNVVSRDALPVRFADSKFRCLFVGNLGFPPNVHGLMEFMKYAWTESKRAMPELEFDIVGFNPSAEVTALGDKEGVTVHANVPSLKGFYQNCDLVIVPILYGSGTRVKIVEAMAYGRPVLSTNLGAEGLDLENGRQILLVESIDDFPAALKRIRQDRTLARSIADEARTFQEQHFGPPAVAAAMLAFLQ
ncbi:glycosyltransferase [Sphingomonas sp. BAUL-RG-20F-R05-02]|uniref:glycosyltransferase n=1 Tax=Sphingomonas sp. BAUL-RG-20F-R05-02 TaxID=2914830 RepID=UPI001F59859E|nr:glycosyltransferase [Sphingomonas sp. BAUL-RG-20F-R05-02]